MTKTIIFTGGGSGGHVMPAITIIKYLPQEFTAVYIGGSGIERELISPLVTFHQISTGKLRRYFDWENFLDFFRFLKGIIDALFILRRYRKSRAIIFSTGGYVSLPVVISGFLLRFKIVIHEQTGQIGLANTIASYFADKILVSFPESMANFPRGKTFFTGYPLREEIFSNTINLVTLDDRVINGIDRKIILVTGGGNGSKLINDLITRERDNLGDFFILHQVGRAFIGQYRPSDNYIPFDFSPYMIDLLKLSSVAITLSGAGIVNELMALNKRAIFIPLKGAQKNEQLFNAKFAQKKINASIISEDDLAGIDLRSEIDKLMERVCYETRIDDARSKILEYLI
jgi:UDP-N-acetylglucosamine--N-acetylmuramyl-(pentapeptide) pyrophosphoryl-undecaprenol N-acetylglucosamine transferase